MTKRPVAIAEWNGGRLVPATISDAELLADEKQGQQFDLVRRSKRSTPHNSLYWSQLSRIIKATEAFPTVDAMHLWIKIKLGYVAPIFGPKGQVVGMTVDSTAFAKMDQSQFNVFHEKAARLIAEEIGIDIANV